jgi:hypothetical protein
VAKGIVGDDSKLTIAFGEAIAHGPVIGLCRGAAEAVADADHRRAWAEICEGDHEPATQALARHCDFFTFRVLSAGPAPAASASELEAAVAASDPRAS